MHEVTAYSPLYNEPLHRSQCYYTFSEHAAIDNEIPKLVECGKRQDQKKRGDLLTQLLEVLREERMGNMEARIVGGTEAEHGMWPFMAALGTKEGGPICGASLITKDWVVTAAHCDLIGKIKPCDWNVRLGEWSMSSPNEKHIDATPAAVYVHHKYRDNAEQYDIALIKLSKPAPIDTDNYVNTVCIPTKGQVYGKECYGMGWGDLKYDAQNFPDKTRHVHLPILDPQICKDAYGEDFKAGMLCAGHTTGGKDTCQGDSGGPLVCKQEDGKYVQAGVVSWGYGCAAEGKPGVYSDLQYFIDWIEFIMYEDRKKNP